MPLLPEVGLGRCGELGSLVQGLVEEACGRLGQLGRLTQDRPSESAALPRGKALGAGVKVFSIAVIGQDYVRRGVEGELVQSGGRVHQIGVDIQLMAVPCDLHGALTSSTLLHLGIAQASLALRSTSATPPGVVVGVVAVVAVVDDGVEAAVLGPEEEAGLDIAPVMSEGGDLAEISGGVPAEVVKRVAEADFNHDALRCMWRRVLAVGIMLYHAMRRYGQRAAGRGQFEGLFKSVMI